MPPHCLLSVWKTRQSSLLWHAEFKHQIIAKKSTAAAEGHASSCSFLLAWRLTHYTLASKVSCQLASPVCFYCLLTLEWHCKHSMEKWSVLCFLCASSVIKWPPRTIFLWKSFPLWNCRKAYTRTRKRHQSLCGQTCWAAKWAKLQTFISSETNPSQVD